jgi:DNA-binding response OmpR family regulator
MNFLIIEDDKETIEFLERSLSGEGFVIDTAEDGEVGSYKARINNYDLIILDNNLPKKDGRQICSEIRKNKNNVPIIMLSVNSDIDTKAELLNLGVDDYMTKPFSFSELLARVRALLRRPNKIEPNIFKVEDLMLDVNAHTVKRGGKEIYLTLKEFVLFEYLMRNRGRVLSRAEILDHVFDMNMDPFTNTIETHILNLRKKIKDRNSEIVLTVPGVGYKIN